MDWMTYGMSEYKLKRHEIEKLGITTNNTQVERIPQTKGGEWTIVTLHSTDIVKFKHTGGFLDQILLDTGGYNTVTTRRRMNEVSQAYGLGFHVYQKKHKLYVAYKGNDYEFDGGQFTIKVVHQIPVSRSRS